MYSTSEPSGANEMSINAIEKGGICVCLCCNKMPSHEEVNSAPAINRRYRCCKKIRTVKSKGAITVLSWVLLVWTSFIFLGGSSNSTGVQFVGNHGLLQSESIPLTLLGRKPLHYACYATVALVWFLGTPLAGWLADVRFTRYRVIQVSLWIMWSGVLTHSCLYLIHYQDQDHPGLEKVRSGISFVALIVYIFGLVGFLINSVQFGIDQMPDASSSELSAFIQWYTFATCAGIWFPQAVLGLISSCPSSKLSKKDPLTAMQLTVLTLLPISLLSLTLLMDSYLHHHMIIEPHTSNPFKLVAGVLKYIAVHKKPTKPSAFVYTLNKIPNRFDFAKTQYGGPYTTEQVEDVKTLLRIIFIMSPVVLVLACTTLTAYHLEEFESHLRNCTTKNISECSQTVINSFGYNYWFIAMLLIISHEFLVPLAVHRFNGLCCKTLRRITIGTALVFLLSLVLVALEVKGNASPHVTCKSKNCTLGVHYLPIVLPINIVLAFQTLFFITGAWEFICAQAPYSMRGLLIGAVWATEGFGAILSYIIKVSWYHGSRKGHSTKIGNLACGGTYFIFISALSFVGLVLFCIAVRCYRPRMREEAEDRQHLVEEIYSKEINQIHTKPATLRYTSENSFLFSQR